MMPCWCRADRYTLAKRLGTPPATNIVEKLVEKETRLEWCGLRPCYAGDSSTFLSRTFYLEKTEAGRVTVKPLEQLGKQGGFKYDARWNFWPISGTDLWLAVRHNPLVLRGGDRFGDREVKLEVYVFDVNVVVRERVITTFLPEGHNRGFPDYRLDPQNWRLTYKTREGYKTYNVLEGIDEPVADPVGPPFLPKPNTYY